MCTGGCLVAPLAFYPHVLITPLNYDKTEMSPDIAKHSWDGGSKITSAKDNNSDKKDPQDMFHLEIIPRK
jgi:hypothetical protein